MYGLGNLDTYCTKRKETGSYLENKYCLFIVQPERQCLVPTNELRTRKDDFIVF